MRDFVNVFTASVAKELLKKGFTIADLKKDKYDPEGKRTIFVFKNETGLEETIKEVITEERKYRESR